MFLTRRFFKCIIALIVLIAFGFWVEIFYLLGILGLVLFVCLALFEIAMLYRGSKNSLQCERICEERFSNGDDNPVEVQLTNNFGFDIDVEVIDECPAIFQMRDFSLFCKVPKGKTGKVQYTLKPTMRGEYKFGNINALVSSKIRLVSRRFVFKKPCSVKVYPSFVMLHKYALLSTKNFTQEFGLKQVRRIGQSLEFEHIRDYVKGDDFRHINWKAGARRNHLMVNVYQEEQSQCIYNVIDKGRAMRKAFDGMTLLNYAVNASLFLGYASLKKSDKAGLVTFERSIDTFVPASKKAGQIGVFQDVLYKQKSSFYESDYEALFGQLSKLVRRRSLLVIYTDFDNKQSLRRQLPYLKTLAKKHVVLVVFFEDKELKNIASKRPKAASDYFEQVIAEKFMSDKRSIQMELNRHGIYALLTPPKDLSVNVLNKYLELKSRAVI